MTIEQRIADAGYTLPEVSKPLAAYVPTMRTGDLVFTSGQLPLVDGKLPATGKVGAQVTQDEAAKLAKVCVLNGLAAIKAEIGDLENIDQVVKVVGFVSSNPEFSNQHLVINGASEFLGEVLGEAGIHARSAVGVPVLPMDAPVEVELVVRVKN